MSKISEKEERLRCPIGRISEEEERLMVNGMVRSAWRDGDERTKQRVRDVYRRRERYVMEEREKSIK